MSETGNLPPTIGDAPPTPIDPVFLAPALDDYEILGKLGEGGMGLVYRAREKSLQRVVALKMIRAGLYAGEHDLARFRVEAEAAARLQHPNVVQVYRVGQFEDSPGSLRPFMVLEYVDGGSLADRLNSTPLPPKDAARLCETLARAVHAAHQAGIIHRDLKPANVLLVDRGSCIVDRKENAASGSARSTDHEPRTTMVPKITDFGLAKKLDDPSGPTVSGAIMGTPSYMSPEQAMGRSSIDARTDVWSLGAILYECLTGRPPFRAATVGETLQQVREAEPVPPSRLVPRCDRDAETICLKCLRKEPGQRYASAGELADDLHRFAHGEAILARPVGPAERLRRWCRRKPVQAALTAALLLVTVIGIAGVWSQWRIAERKRAEADERAQESERRFQLALATNLSVSDLGEKLRPLATSQSATVEKILELAAENFARLEREVGPTKEIRAGKARMLSSFSELYWLMSRSARAEETAKQSVALWQGLHEEEPGEHRAGLSLALLRLALATFTRGNSQAAVDAARAAVALCREVHEERMEDDAARTELAAALATLSRLLETQGNLEEAETLREESAGLIEAVNGEGRQSLRWQLTFVRYRRQAADRHYYAGRLAEALEAYALLMRQCDDFVKAHPEDGDLQALRLDVEGDVGWTLIDLGRADEARPVYRRVVERAELLAQDDPNNAQWKRSLLRYRLKQADIADKPADLPPGRIADLLRRQRRTLEELQTLAERQLQGDPGNAQHEEDIGTLLVEQATASAALAWLGEDRAANEERALARLAEADRRLARLAALDLLCRRWAMMHTTVSGSRSLALRVLGRKREANGEQIVWAKRKLAWHEAHAVRRPESRARQKELASAWMMLGLQWNRLGDADPSDPEPHRQAHIPLRMAKAILAKLREAEPDDLALLDQSARTSQVLRNSLHHLGRWTDADAEAESALPLERKLEELRKQQKPPSPVPSYSSSSILALTSRLVAGVETADLGREQLEVAEQTLLQKPGASEALQAATACRALAQTLQALPNPESLAERARVLSRAAALRPVIEKEGALGPQLVKAFEEMAAARAKLEDVAPSGDGRATLQYADLARSMLEKDRKEDLLQLVLGEMEATSPIPTWQARLVLDIGYDAALQSALASQADKRKDILDSAPKRRLATFFRLCGDDGRAKALASETVPLPPGVVNALRIGLMRDARWADCERLLERALAEQKGLASHYWLESLFECRMEQRKLEKADESLTRLEGQVQDSVDGRKRRGRLAFEQRRFAVCEKAFQGILDDKSARAVPWRPFARLMLARVHLERGDGAKAEEQAKAFLAESPQSPFAPFLMGYVLAAQGKRLEEAEKHARAALSAGKGNKNFQSLLAWIETFGSKPEEALARLESLHDKSSQDPIVWDELGDVYARLGKQEKATECWRKAQELLPASAESGDLRKKGLARKLKE